SVLDQDVLALDITEFTQPLAECLDKVRTRLGFSRQITDTGNLLLRLSGKRRGEKAAREGRHEPPASKRMVERFASFRGGHRPPIGERSNRRESSRGRQVPRPRGLCAEFSRRAAHAGTRSA